MSKKYYLPESDLSVKFLRQSGLSNYSMVAKYPAESDATYNALAGDIVLSNGDGTGVTVDESSLTDSTKSLEWNYYIGCIVDCGDGFELIVESNDSNTFYGSWKLVDPPTAPPIPYNVKWPFTGEDIFTLASRSDIPAGATINFVRANIRHKTYNNLIQVGIYLGFGPPVQYPSEELDAGSAFVDDWWEWINNPQTSAPWTVANIKDDLSGIGYIVGSNSDSPVRVSGLYLEVDYTESGDHIGYKSPLPTAFWVL